MARIRTASLGMARRLLHADFQRRRRAAQRQGMLANEDHLAIRDLGLAVAKRHGVPCLLYEELPYLWSASAESAVQDVARTWNCSATAVAVSIDRTAKHERMAHYHTQLAVMDPEARRLEQPSTLPTVEHYWIVDTGPCGGTDEPPADAPQASVIIAVYNGTSTLSDQLTALAHQIDPPSFEVLVMDNNSTDNPSALVDQYRGRLDIRIVPAGAEQGQCYARNTGALQARGRHLLICDQDDVVSSGWVRSLADTLDEASVLATGPIEVTQLNDSEVWRIYTEGADEGLLRPYAVQGYLPFAYGCNMGIRREDYLRLGGMDNSYRGGDEDTDFSWRAQEAGMPLVCVESAVVHYRLRRTTRDLFRQRRGYGRTRVLTWVRTRGTRPLAGMSLAWTLRQAALIPFRWFKHRRTGTERLAWALQSGALLGNLDGQLLYRVLRRTPSPQLLARSAPRATSTETEPSSGVVGS